MTDIEICRRCAAKMEIALFESSGVLRVAGVGGVYWPLTDDAQCMALAKRFKPTMFYDDAEGGWDVGLKPWIPIGYQHNLNRAICLVVAGSLNVS